MHSDPEKILLSVIVVIVSDTTNRDYDLSPLEGCLEALCSQFDPPDFEILVPYPSEVSKVLNLSSKYPQVLFVPVENLKSYHFQNSGREHHDELRARGIAAAHGNIICMLEDHARPDANWSRRVLDAHLGKYHDYAAVGGAIENDIDRTLNWAIYFCDFGKYQNPLPEGDSSYASDANISYKRNALTAIFPVWQEAYQETAVNWSLLSRGEKIALSAEIIVYQHRKNINLTSAFSERIIWGKSYAKSRAQIINTFQKIVYTGLSPLLPFILFVRMSVMTLKKGRHIGRYLNASPLILFLLAGWSLGEFSGYLSPN